MSKIVEIKIIDDIKYKECTKCKEWKSFDEYSKRTRGKLGIYSYCKKCYRKEFKEYYEQNKEYYKEYKEQNKENTKKYNKEYYEQNKEHYKEYYEQNKEYYKEYKEQNKENTKKYNKEYYEQNKEKVRVYREQNREKIKENENKRLKTDPEFRLRKYIRRSNYTNLQRAIKYYLEGRVDKFPSKSPSRLLLKLYEVQNHVCPYCSSDMRDNIHIDHIIPLSKNGSNDVENLILCCSTCNLSKNAKDLEDWLKECNIDYNDFIDSIEERNRIYFSEVA